MNNYRIADREVPDGVGIRIHICRQINEIISK